MAVLTETTDKIEEARWQVWNLPRASHLAETVSGPAELHPDLVCVVTCPHGERPDPINWGELRDGAAIQAQRLLEAGLVAGDRVLILLPTSRAFLEVFFGVLWAGGVPTPLPALASSNPKRAELYNQSIANFARDSEASLCAASETCIAALERWSAPWDLPTCVFPCRATTSEERKRSVIPPPRPPRNGDTALLQYTSGSTNSPKGVQLSHDNILSNAESIAAVLVEAGTVCVSWLPLYHDMGLIGTLLTALYTRSPLVLMPTSAFIRNPASWLEAISEYRATCTVAPHFAYRYAAGSLEPERMPGVRLDSLRSALDGAEPIDEEGLRLFHEKFRPLGLRDGVVRPVYGLAECSLAVSFEDQGRQVIDQIDADKFESTGQAEPSQSAPRRRTVVSVGRPIPGVEVRVIGRRGETLPDRRQGEIVVRGPSVMKSYRNRPRETARALRGGWLHTGDLGYLADGRLYMTGRRNDVIIRRGRNYHPQDLEAALSGLEGVQEGGAAVFEAGGRIVAAVETRLRDPVARERLEQAVRSRSFDVFEFGPDHVLLLRPASLPRTTSGKLRRGKARRLFLAGVPDWRE